MAKWSKAYIEESFPGLPQDHTPLELIQLLTTQNPDALIRSKVANDGGFQPCGGMDLNLDDRLQLGQQNFYMTNSSCKDPEEFIHDGWGYCYSVHEIDIDHNCGSHDAKMLSFDNDDEVEAFIRLLKSGTYTHPYE